ncbi:ferric-chelate reductase Frp1 [Saxophila tyrrhenica]|uniref:ferric-chelate reductase (NADPH) n=1 Tax=Saxophila tyrrhenica TaxID=1690608 RepID=A0AAV9PRA9_9PEZI|nr:ferric-chelate reductase Frp1 [Saxophila tyrrhenica]
MSMSMDMDMSSSGPFKATNQNTALGYCTELSLFNNLFKCPRRQLTIPSNTRILRALESRRRRKTQQPSHPQGVLQQSYATIAASLRELSYPQPIFFTGRLSKHFTPLPVGRWLILVIYWTMLLCFLWSDTIVSPDSPMYAYKWEKVGFRAAWVSVAQIPFIYLLSCKFNPITLLTGISYERFNWLHRWAARTVFLTVAVHWSFFYTEWSLANYVKLEFEMMPMVKYGFGAWSVIGWMILSGFGFVRHLSYEVFVAQHICAAATLLWLLYVHVPAYARYNLYMAMGFIGFDWGSRIVWTLLRNTHLLDHGCKGALGYAASLEALPGDMVRITIENAGFKWGAGQHVYIAIPRLRPFGLHPFTIATACQRGNGELTSPLTMVVKAHSGYSRALHRAALREGDRTYRTFLTGPWGSPPDLYPYDSVVLIACSSGASFTTPLVQELVRRPACVRNVVLHWIVRSEEHFSWYKSELQALAEATQSGSLSLQIVVHVTNPSHSTDSIAPDEERKMTDSSKISAVDSESDTSSSMGSLSTLLEGKRDRFSSTLSMRSGSRPSVESMIRPMVEAALSETAVVVCGGVSITAQARTFVAALSDERAVHKGSGAQGIYLFSETYGW